MTLPLGHGQTKLVALVVIIFSLPWGTTVSSENTLFLKGDNCEAIWDKRQEAVVNGDNPARDQYSLSYSLCVDRSGGKAQDTSTSKEQVVDRGRQAEAKNEQPLNTNQQDQPAVSQPESLTRLALLIGNANYQTSPLANPVNDVRGMAAALRKAGFTVIKHENLNFRQMREAIRDFGEKLSKDHVGLFYYSGHGVQVDGRNYLIPVNSDIKYEDEVASSALDAEMVLAKLESAKNKLNIVVLDACRDSPLGRRTRTSTKGLSNMNAASGTMIAFSTAPGQVALDGKGSNSPYTKYLISAIQKEGLLLEQVFKEVRGNVMKDTNGTQVPWENSSILGDFYFVPKKD